MKTPDKIYVSIRDLQNGYTTDICLSQEKGYSAYIRKEALMEWLKAKRAPFMGDNDYGKGNIDALDEVINRLNEI